MSNDIKGKILTSLASWKGQLASGADSTIDTIAEKTPLNRIGVVLILTFIFLGVFGGGLNFLGLTAWGIVKWGFITSLFLGMFFAEPILVRADPQYGTKGWIWVVRLVCFVLLVFLIEDRIISLYNFLMAEAILIVSAICIQRYLGVGEIRNFMLYRLAPALFVLIYIPFLIVMPVEFKVNNGTRNDKTDQYLINTPYETFEVSDIPELLVFGEAKLHGTIENYDGRISALALGIPWENRKWYRRIVWVKFLDGPPEEQDAID